MQTNTVTVIMRPTITLKTTLTQSVKITYTSRLNLYKHNYEHNHTGPQSKSYTQLDSHIIYIDLPLDEFFLHCLLESKFVGGR